MGEIIEIKNLCKSFDSLSVLEDINLRIEENKFISVVGPSGCGKTTLLKIIGGIIPPTSGEVLIGSRPSFKARKKGEFGFVFQNPVMLPWRSVYKNIKLPFEILGRDENPKIESRIDELLEAVELKEKKNRPSQELSGGEKQRISLTRALALNPKILLLDEPFGSLDYPLREDLNHVLLKFYRKYKTTTIFVTHKPDESVFMADEVVVLTDKPSRIYRRINVDFSRPRDFKVLRRNKIFLDTVEWILDSLDI